MLTVPPAGGTGKCGILGGADQTQLVAEGDDSLCLDFLLPFLWISVNRPQEFLVMCAQ